jgi:hypothetical protein
MHPRIKLRACAKLMMMSAEGNLKPVPHHQPMSKKSNLSIMKMMRIRKTRILLKALRWQKKKWVLR